MSTGLTEVKNEIINAIKSEGSKTRREICIIGIVLVIFFAGSLWLIETLSKKSDPPAPAESQSLEKKYGPIPVQSRDR